jgi:chitinase
MRRFHLIATTLLTLIASVTRPSPAVARPDHVVLGYVPQWRDAIADPRDFHYDAFTHLARAFLRPRPDGTLLVADGYFNADFEHLAHDHGVRLLMSIGGEAGKANAWLATASDPHLMAVFLDTLAGLYAQHPLYDGVDVDWEPSPATDAAGHAYADLLKAIRRRFPGKLLTIAIPSKDYAVAHVPIADVVAAVDLINVMAYDYSGPWTGLASFGSNLHAEPGKPTAAPFSADQGMTNLIEHRHFPPAKLVLGMTFWANRFRVDHLGDSFTKNGSHLADTVEYPAVLDLLATGRFTAARDDTADSCYLTRSTGGGTVIVYDDPKSVRDKCDTALRLGCAGVMIWHAGADLAAGRTPLLDAIGDRFGVAAPAGPSLPALRREVARFRGKPVDDGESLESLLAADQKLRLARATADDNRWVALPTSRPAK